MEWCAGRNAGSAYYPRPTAIRPAAVFDAHNPPLTATPCMCLILFAVQQHPEFPLALAANRDERYLRPTQPLAPWPEAPQVLAGRDLEAGGSWFGVTRSGRFAAVTNVREWPPQSGWPRSRGALVRDFLLGAMSAADYAADCVRRDGQYAGFNLLLGDLHRCELWYCSNRGDDPLRQLRPGLYGLSNGALGDCWPKSASGSAALRAELLRGPTTDGLLALLGDRTVAADAELPDTGVGIDMERMLSPRFIASPDYGTRASTALLLDRHGNIALCEQNFAADGIASTRQHFDWRLDA